LALLATINLEVVTFRAYPPLIHFFNESWKSCFMRVLSTAYDSASLTSIVLKWRSFSFIFNLGNRVKQGGLGTTAMLLLVKYSRVKNEE
jgi:hypothetical protein